MGSCANNNVSPLKKDTLPEYSKEFDFLNYKLSGKRFKYNPGLYDRGVTRAISIDRHNEAWREYGIDSILYEDRLCALDNNSLKTVVLIYSNINKFSIGKFIDGDVPNDSSELFMGYLDLQTMEVKKIVTLKDSGDKRTVISKKIIEIF